LGFLADETTARHSLLTEFFALSDRENGSPGVEDRDRGVSVSWG